MKRTIVLVTAILAVAGLAAYAVSKGHDTAIITIAFSLIGGFAGYEFGKPKA